MAAHKTVFAFRLDNRAVHQSCLRAERLKALEVLVDGTHAEIAAAGQRNLRLAVLAQQRAQKIIRSAHSANQIGGGGAGADVRGVDIKGGLVDSSHLGAHLLQNFADKRHVTDVRYIFNLARLIAKDNRGNNGHCGVLGAADIYLAKQRLSACNYKLLQLVYTPIQLD